jgi:phage-related protein
MKYKIELYQEAVYFILSQNIKMQAKIQRTISLLRMFGYSLPNPHSKKIRGGRGLYELRVKQGNDICRLFYFYYVADIYIVISGYVKKRNRIDKNELARARKLMTKIIYEKNKNN